MRDSHTLAVVIPAFNEAASIGKVIANIPATVSKIVVVDNGSTDATATQAKAAGATVLHEPRKGYGHACLKGLAYLSASPPDIVVFLDGDFSDYPEELPLLTDPIRNGQVDFVVGARHPAGREKGALTPQQIFGNALACTLMRWLYGGKFTDLGPFRAIRWQRLQQLQMEDKTYGWTVEMQLKVLRHQIPYSEVPVRYKKRIGQSKVSGTVKGTIFAGVKIISWIVKYYF
ncbi:MAG: glycosyltransferase family 2 protein [Flavobacteriaceae bacterium]